MTTGADEDWATLGRRAAAEPPPSPSPSLLAAVGAMKPVRARTRFGAFAVALALGALWPAFILARAPLRRDIGALPPAWVAGGALLWAVAVVACLVAALVPRRGDVLPAASRALSVGAAATAALVAFALLGTVEAPGLSLHPADVGKTLFQSLLGCGRTVLQVAAVFVIVGAIALRRVLPTGGRGIGVALGAAGGALGGLLLHLLCPIATTAHVVLSHAGGMVLAAAIGAVVMRIVVGR